MTVSKERKAELTAQFGNTPVDTSSAPGTLDAHDPHMRPPAWGEKYDSMGSPHSTQAEKSGR